MAGPNFALRQHFNFGLQERIFLAHNLVKYRSSHSGFLKLLEGTAGFNTLVLPCVTDEQHAVFWPKSS